MKIEDLTMDERVFLAGALKVLVLSDGVVDDEEIQGVDALRDVYHFDDMDECLERFEERVSSDEEFDRFAASITRPEARDLILGELDRISLRGGFQDHQEEFFLKNLRALWGR